MGFFSWKTADTGESIWCEEAELETKPVYLLPPDGYGHILELCYQGHGVFGGVDAYEWLARRNLPKERIDALSDEELRWAGVGLAYGKYFVDAFTGARFGIFHDHLALIDPTITIHRIKYNEPVPGYDGLTVEQLAKSGAVVAHGFETPLPLKFSHDVNARYADLPASEDCPHQGWITPDDEDVAVQVEA